MIYFTKEEYITKYKLSNGANYFFISNLNTSINNVSNNGYSTNIINNVHIKVINTIGNTIGINNGNITMDDGYIEVSGNGTNTYNMYNVNATITGANILLNSKLIKEKIVDKISSDILLSISGGELSIIDINIFLEILDNLYNI